MSTCKRLIQLGNRIVDSRILHARFACDLAACRGACCLEGDAGAPLTHDEIVELEIVLPDLLPHLDEAAREALRKGVAYRDAEGDWVTRLVQGAQCAFSIERGGCHLCVVEWLCRQGACQAEKPLSCHLYPIRVGRSGPFTLLRYDVWDICEPARARGAALDVRVYQFLRKPLVRAFGEAFYHELDEAARLPEGGGDAGCEM